MPGTGRSLIVAAALVSAALAACGPAVSPSPAGSGSIVPASPAASSPAGSPPATPSGPATSASPATPSASSGVSPEPSRGTTPCTVTASTGALRSDRLVDVRVASGTTGDAVTFVFGPASTPPAPTSPQGAVEEASPPFTMDPSGMPLTVAGQRFVRVRFEGLTLFDSSGTLTYGGPDRIAGSAGGPIREVVKEAEFEGISAWIVGYDAGSCPILASDPSGMTISLIFPTS